MSDLSPAAPAPAREGMPLDQFLAETNDQVFELIDGLRREKMPAAYLHSRILMRLLFAVHHYLLQDPLGVIMAEAAFVLPERNDPNWVKGSRVPDLMFISRARIEAYEATMLTSPNWESRPLMLVPDLVIEIVSPNDNASQLNEKIGYDLLNGVREVWVIYPATGELFVHTPDSETVRVVRRGLVFSGSDVLPGFTLALNDLFTEGLA
jgi:Uma2 family endonuclease